ncbi:FecR family protein [Methylobacterium sp. R2-1]|uniref:FecR family protein n=1 Tax=Methylobacterium sp. R2-1 TaxID=2587064 RepID=UPI001618DD8B|nr:FecR domain-containing protein [Methylobacterium sp. R2-1]MBB2965063.1 transmembrane sensor [Methylobacterium sp. R2-1]
MPQPEAPDDALDPLTEQALEWQVRLHSGDDDVATAQAYEAWKHTDPAHQAAAEQAEELWRTLGVALPRRRHGPPKAAIAVLLCGLGALGGVAVEPFGPPQAWLADERTATGERRSMVLSDGSQVDLDGGTSFDIVFGPDQRRLVLYTGQIYVAVHPDKARPFEVADKNGTARALGTAFGVSRDGAETGLFVAESTVRVHAADAPEAAGIDVHAGEEVTFTAARAGAVRKSDIGSRAAWRQGQLVFDGRPLKEVVAALGRYRRGRIVVMDHDLNGLRVSGNFSTADSDKALDAMAAALPIRIRRLPLLTLIQRDPTRAAP